jgi:ribosomal protein S1
MTGAEEQIAVPGSVQELGIGMSVRGKIKRIELYGAFVDIGVGQDGLLHISQLGKPNVRNVEDVVKEGDEVTVFVLKVEPDSGRIALSLVKPPATSWEDLEKDKVVSGTVVRLEKFGVFVDIGAERPGMIHVSELATGFVNSPSDVVSVGDEVRAKIISVNRKKKRIDLSLKALEEVVEVPRTEEDDERVPTAMELALRRAMEGGGAADTDESRDKRKKQKRSNEMDDVISRTLKNHVK